MVELEIEVPAVHIVLTDQLAELEQLTVNAKRAP
jgi:hypothetical protein